MKIDQRLKFSSLTGNSGKIKRATGRPKSKPFSKGVHIDQNAVSTYKRTSGICFLPTGGKFRGTGHDKGEKGGFSDLFKGGARPSV